MRLVWDHQTKREQPMKLATIALATAFALSGTLAFAPLEPCSGRPAASKTCVFRLGGYLRRFWRGEPV
jgi:hypothetical protein